MTPGPQPGTATDRVTAALVDHLETRKTPTLTFREVALDGSWGSAGRLDLVSLAFGPNRTIGIDGYEIKVSRNDFHRDVDARKYLRYLPSVDRLTFVCPTGLVRAEEVPPGVGFVTWNPARPDRPFATVRRPDFHHRSDTGQLVRLLRRVHHDRDQWRQTVAQAERGARIAAMFDKAQDLVSAERRYGLWLSAAVRDRIRQIARDEARADAVLADAEQTLERARVDAERITETARRHAAGIAELAPTVAVLQAAVELAAGALHGSHWGGGPRLDHDAAARLTAEIRAVTHHHHREASP